MQELNDTARRRQPIRLLRNRIYPTYQLAAMAGRRKQDPQAVLTVAVLETFSWLRRRFRDLTLPAELNWPEPADFENADLSALASFRIDAGYKVEVIWLPDELIWSLQMTEPDLGPDPGADQQSRGPVAGRLFETNIAYRVVSGQVACGFCTLVSDPEHNTAPCEVFRLAVVGQLVRNPRVGLWHGWPLSYSPHVLDRQPQMQQLKEWLKDPDRMLPAVIVAASDPVPPGPESWPSIEELRRELGRAVVTPAAFLPVPQSSSVLQQPEPVWPFDLASLAHRKMGYAHFFAVPHHQLPAFNKVTGLSLQAGGILLAEPSAYGGDTQVFSRQKTTGDPNRIPDWLDRVIQDYPMNKPVRFGPVAFLPEAKMRERARILDLNHSKEEILQAGLEREQALLKRHQDEIRRHESLCALKQAKVERLEEKIRTLEHEKKDLSEEKSALVLEFKQQLEQKDEEIRRFEELMARPAALAAVPGWAARHFCGRLVLLQRAQRELTAVDPDSVNLPLLCDALEYLAMEYRDALLGMINSDECLQRCAQKYNRGFSVTPVKGVSVEMYPADYMVKYDAACNGQLVDRMLNLHLRVGGKSDHLLRIYFFYDKSKKHIVIGSLPRHLRTVSYD